MANKLILMRGLPGDGKSTRAKAIADDAVKQGKRAIILSTDDIISGRSHYEDDSYLFCMDYHGKAHELNQAKTREACRRGFDYVIVDNTNTTWRECKPYFDIAKEFNYEISLEKSLAHWAGDPEECWKKTTHAVPQETIKKMKARFQSDAMIWRHSENAVDKKDDISPLPAKPYIEKAGLPACIICDLDGTLCEFQKEGTGPNCRNPYDCSRCDEIDTINPSIQYLFNIIQFMNRNTEYNDEYLYTVLMSGRDSKYRPQTERWLKNNCVKYDYLHMRKEGDNRKDCIIKQELFDLCIRDKFNVKFVLDDRSQVVQLWRDLGLRCWQVAYGDF